MSEFENQTPPALPEPPPEAKEEVPVSAVPPSTPRSGACRPPREKKKMGCLPIFLILCGILAVVTVVTIVGSVVALVFSSGSISGHRNWTISQTVIHDSPNTTDRIAVIDIRGVIMGTDTPKGTSSGIIKSVLTEVQRDKNVAAIVLNLDTPGGEVIASDEIYNAVAAVDIPVVACMRSVCASGGYYIASAADYIVANEVTLTGSIGVIIPRYRYKDMLDKIGVEVTSIRSGVMKDMLSGGRSRSEQEEATIDNYVQSLVDETFRRFCVVVAEGRDKFLTWEDVKESPFGDGRVLLGRQAMELGLVDECGYFEQAIAAAKRLAGLKDADVIRYQRNFTLTEMLLSQAKTDVKIQTGLESALPALKPTQMYYMMPNLAE